jgi:hypothetical protein
LLLLESGILIKFLKLIIFWSKKCIFLINFDDIFQQKCLLQSGNLEKLHAISI